MQITACTGQQLHPFYGLCIITRYLGSFRCSTLTGWINVCLEGAFSLIICRRAGTGNFLVFCCCFIVFFFFKSIVSVFLSGKEIDNHSEFKIIKSSDNELMLKNCHAERAVRSQVRVHYVIGQPSLLLCRGNSWRNPA